MKFSASAVAIILGATHATATTICANGHREVIAPGYTVEYKCDVAKLGGAKVHTQHGKDSVINKREYRVWCSRHHDANGFKEELKNVHTLADCADECTRRSWCVFVHQGIHQTLCRLYDRKVSAATTPGLSTPQWHYAVKK